MGRGTTIRLGLIISLLWTVAGEPSTAAKKETWVLVETPHFTVASNAGENWARVVAAEFEKIRAVFLRALASAEEDPYQPIIILAVKNEKSFQELLPEYWETKGPRPSGVFLQGADKHFIVLRVDMPRGFRAELIYHEYFHLLTAVNLGAVPIWFAEGMAEFWGNTVIRGMKVEMGLPNQDYIRYLERRRLIPPRGALRCQERPSSRRSKASDAFLR